MLAVLQAQVASAAAVASLEAAVRAAVVASTGINATATSLAAAALVASEHISSAEAYALPPNAPADAPGAGVAAAGASPGTIGGAVAGVLLVAIGSVAAALAGRQWMRRNSGLATSATSQPTAARPAGNQHDAATGVAHSRNGSLSNGTQYSQAYVVSGGTLGGVVGATGLTTSSEAGDGEGDDGLDPTDVRPGLTCSDVEQDAAIGVHVQTPLLSAERAGGAAHHGRGGGVNIISGPLYSPSASSTTSTPTGVAAAAVRGRNSGATAPIGPMLGAAAAGLGTTARGACGSTGTELSPSDSHHGLHGHTRSTSGMHVITMGGQPAAASATLADLGISSPLASAGIIGITHGTASYGAARSGTSSSGTETGITWPLEDGPIVALVSPDRGSMRTLARRGDRSSSHAGDNAAAQ